MTITEYITQLIPSVDPTLVNETKDWSESDKLYIYLHNIQLAHMAEFKQLLLAHTSK